VEGVRGVRERLLQLHRPPPEARVRRSVHLFADQSIYLHISPSIYGSVHPSTDQSIYFRGGHDCGGGARGSTATSATASPAT